MVDEIAKILSNIFPGVNVEKVKEVTPRPEEGKGMSYPFSRIGLMTRREKREAKKTPTQGKQDTHQGEESARETEGKEDKEHVDVIV